MSSSSNLQCKRQHAASVGALAAVELLQRQRRGVPYLAVREDVLRIGQRQLLHVALVHFGQLLHKQALG